MDDLEDVVLVDGAGEDTGELSAGTMQTALHCTFAKLEDLGDLFVLHPLDVSEDQDHPIPLVHAIQCFG